MDQNESWTFRTAAREPPCICRGLILVDLLPPGPEGRSTQTFISRPNLASRPEALFMGTTAKTNPSLLALIAELKAVSREHEAPIWRAIAQRLERRQRNWSEVNLSRVSRAAKEGETVAVPGVLLGSGELKKPLTIATFRASGGARAKVEKAGGQVIGLGELAATNPKGSGVRIVG